MVEGYILNSWHEKNSTKAYFLLRTRNGRELVSVELSKPYFYCAEKDINRVLKIVKDFCQPEIEEGDWRYAFDKSLRLVKVYVDYPEQVAEIRDILQNLGIVTYESDIPFIRRKVHIDAGVNRHIKIEGNEIYPSDDVDILPLMLFWDIECSEKSGKIVSIQTKTWDGEEQFFCYADEKTTIEKFIEYAKDFDFLIGWNSDDFDVPVLKKRCKANKIAVPNEWQFIDMMVLYKFKNRWMTGERAAPWASLDYVATKELGYGKVERHKTIDELFSAYIKGEKCKCEICGEESLYDYGMRDVRLLFELERAFGFVETFIGRCNISGVSIKHAWHSQTIIDVLVLRKAKEKNIVFGNRGCNEALASKMLTGAYVKEPLPGIHKCVGVFDLVSLYNRTAQAFNISPETMDENGDIITAVGRFTSKERGIFPSVLEDLEKVRAEAKEMRSKFEKGSLEWIKYDRKQKSYKTVLLSIIGLFGKTDSRYFHPVLFESVTLTAQTILKKSVEYIETQMLDVSVIYDDTDSLFISFGDINIKDAVMIGEKIAERLNDFYAKQFGSKLILIDFQKLYSALFIGAKKRYAGLEVWAEGKWHEEPKIDAVGLEIVRSEAPEKAKQLQEKVLNMILREQRKYNEVKSFIEKERIKVLNGEDDESLIISKSLGKPIDFYDNARKKPHHVQAAIKMLERGYEVNVGDKIRYVYVRAGSDKVVEPIIEGEPFPKIEYSGREYVWKNLIEPALLRIIEVAYPRTVSIMKWMKEAKYK